MYSIKALSRITGIPANTIRSWERRYGIPSPNRDDMGYRTYSPDDAAYLSLVGRLISSGHSIGKLAALSHEQLNDLEAKREESPLATGSQHLRRQMIECVDKLDLSSFRTTLSLALITSAPSAFAAEIMSPTLQHIGSKWKQGDLTVAQEHAFTAITRQIIFSAINIQHLAVEKQPLAFACPSGERHELGLLLAYYIAASRGHPCTYFGPDMPIESLAEAVKLSGAEVLVISLVNTEASEELFGALGSLRMQLGPETSIWLGTDIDIPAAEPEFLSFKCYSRFDHHLAAQT